MIPDTITDTTITIDHTKSLQDMIAVGTYDWVNPNITPERFRIVAIGTVQFEPKIFHFNSRISSEGAIAAVEADDQHNPWKPAEIEHLLAFGATYPEEQCKYPIVGLGSVARVNSGRHVPCLLGSDALRSLGLRGWVDDWIVRYRFLAVRKLSSAT